MTDYWEQHLARVRGRELADLRLRWDDFYEITWDKQFRAARLDDRATLSADTASELTALLCGDFCERPVKFHDTGEG